MREKRFRRVLLEIRKIVFLPILVHIKQIISSILLMCLCRLFSLVRILSFIFCLFYAVRDFQLTFIALECATVFFSHFRGCFIACSARSDLDWHRSSSFSVIKELVIWCRWHVLSSPTALQGHQNPPQKLSFHRPETFSMDLTIYPQHWVASYSIY